MRGKCVIEFRLKICGTYYLHQHEGEFELQNAEQDREEHKDIAKEEKYEENKEDKVLIKNVLKCIKKRIM